MHFTLSLQACNVTRYDMDLQCMFVDNGTGCDKTFKYNNRDHVVPAHLFVNKKSFRFLEF